MNKLSPFTIDYPSRAGRLGATLEMLLYDLVNDRVVEGSTRRIALKAYEQVAADGERRGHQPMVSVERVRQWAAADPGEELA